ncbi:trypsin-like peptidase domain-containing protein [Polynucleobacter sp. MWH-Adler-W8]|jgi:hypothetical protein|uniref:trypsin-like peptidase domain-containing protein n=1 Tax=Polynucleobacter sp. MWH-Adler-W8 TaxID=1819727 RepID=UPI0009346927|nr:trypsin-like peptidase domain-containing protein [Polynucleobacter sp. MWH-Adler-W8]
MNLLLRFLLLTTLTLLANPIFAGSTALFTNADGTGTGFIISADGYIATAFHVINGAKLVQVRTSNGKIVNAVIVKTDPRNDLAILKIEGTGFKPIQIQSSLEVKRGDKVYAMGFPLLGDQGLEPKLTDGLISSLSGIHDEAVKFQISNPIQPGNSGGPLFLDNGKVVGVISSSLSDVYIFEKSGSLPQNVNYAVKSNYLIELASTVNGLKLAQGSSFVNVFSKKLTETASEVEQSLVLVGVELGKKPLPKIEAKPQPRPAPAAQPPSAPVPQAAPPVISKLPPCVGTDPKGWNNCAGSFRFSNGNFYIGEFKNGQRDGYGALDIVNKGCITSFNCIGSAVHARYAGTFKDDKIDGYGTWFADDGEKYVGQFRMNLRNGKGTLTTKSGTVSGTFKDGIYTGS